MDNQSFSKIWIPIIFVVLFAGGILAWQYFNKYKEVTIKDEIKNETADWEIYKNEGYEFEFKYPPSLIADTSSQGIPFFGDEKTLIFLIGRDNVINFSFRVSVFKGSLELLKNTINNYKEQLRQTYVQLGKKEPQFGESTITIGGKPGFIFIDKNDLNAEFFYTSLDNQNVLLIGKAGNGNYESISDEMLSTFKFIEIEEGLYIKVISPNGGEKWTAGKTHNITWESSGLEGKSANIYLFAYNQNKMAMVPKEEYRYNWNYLITENVSVTQEKFIWEIPADISQRFTQPPSYYKINISSSEELSNWGVEIDNLNLAQSRTYFEISSD